MTEVEAIEAATRRALVAEEAQIDGWWLRCNPDLPNRRPNSATTPPDGRIDPGVVGEIIGWFAARGRPPIIRVLSTSDSRLEEHLTSKGWTTEAPTNVMVSHAIGGLSAERVRAFGGGDGVPDEFVRTRVAAGMTATAAHLVHESGRGMSAGYAIAPATGETVAVGRTEMQDAMVGVYDVVTMPGERRKGWGTDVVRGLLSWAVARGATSAFLQVEVSNEAAVGLYGKLGFEILYTYWYRRPPV